MSPCHWRCIKIINHWLPKVKNSQGHFWTHQSILMIILKELIRYLGGINSVRIFLFPFWNWFYSKRKEFAPVGSKFFPFRVDPFSKGAWCAGKAIEVPKVVSHVNNVETYQVYPDNLHLLLCITRTVCIKCQTPYSWRKNRKKYYWTPFAEFAEFAQKSGKVQKTTEKVMKIEIIS